MNRNEIKVRIQQLCEVVFNLGFPHEDCRKVANLLNSDEDFLPDVNTFTHSIWSLSALAYDNPKRLAKRPTEALKKDKIWLKKSFFERWENYLPAKNLINRDFTPHLLTTLKINDEIRELLLQLISDELQSRKNQIVSHPT